MARTVFSILIGPGIAATVISAIYVAQGYSTAFVPVYYMVTYSVAIFPAAALIVFLKVWRCTRLWHYVLAGSICSLLCTMGFALSAYSGATSFDARMETFLGLWPVMAVGPVTAGPVWIVSEAKWLSWLFPKSTADKEISSVPFRR